MTVTDLDRNDVQGALQVYQTEMAAGTWSADKAEAMLQLQDDPTELLRRLAKITSRHSRAAI